MNLFNRRLCYEDKTNTFFNSMEQLEKDKLEKEVENDLANEEKNENKVTKIICL